MEKIKLNQKNFKYFFTPVGPLHSHHNEQIWPYDYVDRGSDTLLVTIGDSWTWGAGIDGGIKDAETMTKQENTFRVNNLYGNIISRDRDWNWLNLGIYSAGNQWIANKVFELRALEPLLKFKKIVVMCVLTSVGRWFYTWQDSLVDYKKFFRENKMLHHDDYEKFFVDLNRRVIEQIKMLTNSTDTMRLLVGSNAVDHCGFDALDREEIIDKPWYQLLSRTTLKGISVDLDSIKYLQNIEHFLETSDEKFVFKQWMMQKIDEAEKQNAMLTTMDTVGRVDKAHTTHIGHKRWADYILGEVL